MPQWRSWLVIGGYILLAYGACLMLWLATQSFGWFLMEGPAMTLGALFAVGSAVYSAFLFKQARGRVFWHSSVTPVHLLAQAFVAGAALLLLVLAVEAMISGHRAGDQAWQF